MVLHITFTNVSSTFGDPSQMYICRKCQNLANVIEGRDSNDKKIRGPYCRLCQSTDDVVWVCVLYGVKLVGQELFSMGINLKSDTALLNSVQLRKFKGRTPCCFQILKKKFSLFYSCYESSIKLTSARKTFKSDLRFSM